MGGEGKSKKEKQRDLHVQRLVASVKLHAEAPALHELARLAGPGADIHLRHHHTQNERKMNGASVK